MGNKKQISMWLSEDLLTHAAKAAANTGQTRNQWIEHALITSLADGPGVTITQTTTTQWHTKPIKGVVKQQWSSSSVSGGPAAITEDDGL